MSDFTRAGYQAILDAARAHGYRFAAFTEPEAGAGTPRVYLRHDIDNCIESALIMAELEARAQVSATYLALVRSDNYNPFSAASAAMLRRIHALGHEVGLHFTAAGHDRADLERDLAACITADAELLAQATGAPVRVFSFHNPTEYDGFTAHAPGLINAYADRFFADACYLSESNMRWRRPPVQVLAAREHPVIQILVHPLSYRAAFESDRDVLLWFLGDLTRRLLAVNVSENRVLREQGLSLTDVAAHLAAQEPA